MDELIKEAQQIQGFLEITASDDPNELLGRLSDINVYMARSGQMLADAKLLQDRAISVAYELLGDNIYGMPATVVTKLISSKVADENYLVNWLDRINRTCSHQGDNIRTQISYLKEELKLSRTGY